MDRRSFLAGVAGAAGTAQAQIEFPPRPTPAVAPPPVRPMKINYRFVAQNIADLGFTGYVSHEFRPAPGHNPLDCIKEAYDIIDG